MSLRGAKRRSNLSIEFFIDFDGTIAKVDVVDLILETYGSSEWKVIEAQWAQGKIGSRACLSRQMALVNASQSDILKLSENVEVDPYFFGFIEQAKNLGIKTTIASDGFRLVIDGILQRIFKTRPDLLDWICIYSNQLEWVNERLQATFPKGPVCEHDCANCKQTVITRHREFQKKVIFIGDGLSDRYATSAADLTFAKSKLLSYCQKNNIQHLPFDNFMEISEWLREGYSDPEPFDFAQGKLREGEELHQADKLQENLCHIPKKNF